MAYVYDIDPGRNLAVVRAPAAVGVRGLLETQQALYREAAWRPGMNELWDGRAIQKLDVTLEELRAVVRVDAALRERVGEGRAALVAPRAIDFSVARLYTALYRNSPQEIKVFRKIEEADAWLSESTASTAPAG